MAKFFAKNDKVETSIVLSKLISMIYKGKGIIREYILEMSNLAFKLKARKLELLEDLLGFDFSPTTLRTIQSEI